MTEMHDRLRQARERAGFATTADAARALGARQSTYAAHENGQNKFKAEKAAEYGRRFNVKASWLLLGSAEDAPDWNAEDQAGRDVAAVRTDYRRPATNASPPVPLVFPMERIPILGTAVGGIDGKFVLNGQKVMDVLCPPQLIGVPGAYGVFVHGDSMEPRYESGEAVFANPHVPVRQGNYVIVQVAGDFEGDDLSGYVKRFVSMNSRELVLSQFKPREDLEPNAPEAERLIMRFPRDKVVAVHKIVQGGEA